MVFVALWLNQPHPSARGLLGHKMAYGSRPLQSGNKLRRISHCWIQESPPPPMVTPPKTRILTHLLISALSDFLVWLCLVQGSGGAGRSYWTWWHDTWGQWTQFRGHDKWRGSQDTSSCSPETGVGAFSTSSRLSSSHIENHGSHVLYHSHFVAD